MLVLTRKQNEKIRIGNQITITVLRMKGKAVRLGIEAPADVSVLRGELAFKMQEEISIDKLTSLEAAPEQTDCLTAERSKESRRNVPAGSEASDRWPLDRQISDIVAAPLTQLDANHSPWKM